MTGLRRGLSMSALLMTIATAAQAQVPWETPQLLAPHAPRGVSLLAASYAAAPGDRWGAVLTWRRAVAPVGLGFRVAAGEGRGERRAIGAGVEAAGWITRTTPAFPLDVIWTAGLGGSYGSSMQIALPIGIAAGRSLGSNTLWLSPYVSTRAIIEGRIGGRAPDDELDLQLATELGANVSFDRNRRFILRMAAAIGDRSALALGAHLGGGQRSVISANRRNP